MVSSRTEWPYAKTSSLRSFQKRSSPYNEICLARFKVTEQVKLRNVCLQNSQHFRPILRVLLRCIEDIQMRLVHVSKTAQMTAERLARCDISYRVLILRSTSSFKTVPLPSCLYRKMYKEC